MNRKRAQLAPGFTLVEMVVALVIFALVVGSIYSIYVRGEKSEQLGIELAEATQNARSGVDLIARELRSAGYGVNPLTQAAIVVGSQYRVTFALDLNGNRSIDMGEVITYFLDANTSDPLVVNSPNPYDYVLRRKVGTGGDSLAAPAAGAGEIVAYGLTQRSTGSATAKDVPLFSYRDAVNVALELKAGTSNDAAGVFYGKTVNDVDLGKPPAPGVVSHVKTILINMVTETKQKNSETGGYDRVSILTSVEPRNFPYLASANSQYASANTGATGGTGTGSGSGTGSGTGTGTASGTGTGSGSGTGTGLPSSQPPIHIPTDRVLSMVLADLNESDSKEGSNTTQDGQHDLDIVVGTKASGVANIRVWWNGQPDRYAGNVYYQATQNYLGNASYDIPSLAASNIDKSGNEATDIVAGLITGSNAGRGQVWLNEAFGGVGEVPGMIGLPGSPTSPNATFYDNPGTGEVNGVAIGDLNEDGYKDVVLASKTATNQGRVGVWWGDGTGTFNHNVVQDVYAPSGEARSVSVADMNLDGRLDFVVGTKTNNADTQGGVDIFFNTGFSGLGVIVGSYTAPIYRFTTVYTTAVGGAVYALGTAQMDNDSYPDVVTAVKNASNGGKIEFWHNNGSIVSALSRLDQQATPGPALSLALGEVDYGNSTVDIVVGTAGAGGGIPPAVQAFFCDRYAAGGAIIPNVFSWSDANAGGSVNAVAIGHLEASLDRPDDDKLADIVAGTATSASTGDLVIYLNPYASTILP